MSENQAVLDRYFGERLFSGSLNIDIPEPKSLHDELDAGRPSPSFKIPRSALLNMPSYIGDAQVWRCAVTGSKLPAAGVRYWIFRRIGSRVPAGVLELLATEGLVLQYELDHGDPVVIEF